MPLSSLLGTTNQFTVDNTDTSNPIITLSSSFAFPSGINVTMGGSLGCNKVQHPAFSNIWNPLASSYPPSGETALMFSDAAGHLSFSQYYNELFSGSLLFQYGGAATNIGVPAFINKIDNQICVTFNLSGAPLNPYTNANAVAIALGNQCGSASTQFINKTSDLASISSQLIPSYLSNFESLCIGQLPIAMIDPTATNLASSCLQYFIGDVYLYNNTGDAQFYFTLGSSFGAAVPSFALNSYYSFGYLGMKPYVNSDNIDPNPTFNAATYTYSLV